MNASPTRDPCAVAGVDRDSNTSRVVEGLLEKYIEMLRMRERNEVASDAECRVDMASLAKSFPGALREIDKRTLDDIRERIRALKHAQSGVEPAPDWVPIQAAYHGTMRAFLRMRPLLRRTSDGVARAIVEADYEPWFPDEPSRKEMLGPVLDRLRFLPGGRLNPVVFEFVAERLGVEVGEVGGALFKFGN